MFAIVQGYLSTEPEVNTDQFTEKETLLANINSTCDVTIKLLFLDIWFWLIIVRLPDRPSILATSEL